MEISDWIAGGALLVSLGSIIVSLRSNSHSKKSAKAAEESAEAARKSNLVAQEALDLEKERFKREDADANQRERDSIIESGKGFLKEGRKGYRRWFHAHPELFDRSDYFDIIRIVAATTGMFLKSEAELRAFCSEYNITLPDGRR